MHEARGMSLRGAFGALLLAGLVGLGGEARALPDCDVTDACKPNGYNCGSVKCKGNKTVTCGTCSAPQSCGGGGAANVCGCTPSVTKCPAGANCGSVADGCGGTIACGGGCGAGQVCDNNVCKNACTPAMSCPAEKNCGTLDDGCGGKVTCGANGGLCPDGAACSNNVCVACTPATTCPAGATCGTAPDGCGGLIACGPLAGNCPIGQSCVGNTCTSCSPVSCAAAGKNCGSISDGCGGSLFCGSCTAPQTCGGGGTPNVCGVGGIASYPTISFAAGALIIPMDQCYNPSQASAKVVATDWTGGAPKTCGTAAAGDTPACYPIKYSQGDLRKPYGLIYLLAVNHIPVYILNRPDKHRLTDPDFTVTPPPGATKNTVSWLDPSSGSLVANDAGIDCGTRPVSYWGMPLVVDASYAQQAVQLINDFNKNPGMYVAGNATQFRDVPLHIINYPFDAPVMRVIASRPKPVGISPTNFFDGFFTESGITAVVPFGTSAVHLKQTQAPSSANGHTAAYTFPWPSTLPPNPACPGNVCSALTYRDPETGEDRRVIDVFWTEDPELQFWKGDRGLLDYFKLGGIGLVVGRPQGGGKANGVLAWETGTSASMNFLSTKGLAGSSRNGGNFCPADTSATGVGIPGPPTDYPASDPFLQLGGLLMDPIGGGQASDFNFKGAPAAPGTHGLWGEAEFPVIHGHPVVDGVSTPGHLVYEGASNAWSGGSGRKDSGLHIMFNTLIAGGEGGGGGTGGLAQQLIDVELTRSSPVGRDTGELYLGTFDWRVPLRPNEPGNILYQPSKSSYPYVTGHFREFRSGLNIVEEVACDPSAQVTGCNWDAADRIKPWAERNVFVGTKSGTSVGMVKAASLASDPTIAFIAAHVGKRLGGIDYSTAAIVEAKEKGAVTIAGAQKRPGIAYVGARDGMLHAFCVTPEAGEKLCYGTFAPGDEIWALIPPGVKAQMDAARLASDWSQIDVGGVVRVADMEDDFAGTSSKGFRTVLIVGTRESGHVFALDVSNPNPNSYNQDGFKLLWETDGTYVDSGVPSYKMGPTLGASLAATGNTNVAVVTSAVAPTSTVPSGINTYVIRVRDGKVLSADQKKYTRVIPLAGGSSASLPNEVPPLPTLVDLNADGFDETILVADFEGQVRKAQLDPGTFKLVTDPSKTGLLFDASAGCSPNVACQPIGVSPTIGRHGADNRLAAFVATGGTDWARSATTQSYAFGFDLPPSTGGLAVAKPFFQAALGTVKPPLPDGTISTAFPLRAYAQLAIAGTDLYANATVLALNTTNQLIQPVMFPGTYGQVLRWGGLNEVIDTSASLLIEQGQRYAGGTSSVLQTNSTADDGQLAIVGTNLIQRTILPSTSTSLRNKAYAVDQNAATTRNFSVMTWFDLNY